MSKIFRVFSKINGYQEVDDYRSRDKALNFARDLSGDYSGGETPFDIAVKDLSDNKVIYRHRGGIEI